MYNVQHFNIGEILRKYRKQKHFSLEYVGNKIYKTKATISKYEKGEVLPDLKTILELCNILDIDLSVIFPSESPMCDNDFPLDANTFYLYYITGNKLITSTVEIESKINGKFTVVLYNGILKDLNKCAYFYKGSAEFSDNLIYMNFKNISSEKLKMENVQIIVHLPLSNTSTIFNCFVTGLTPNYLPVVKRGIISTVALDINKNHIKKLKISKEELKNISSTNSWILKSKPYDEFFYDLNNVD